MSNRDNLPGTDRKGFIKIVELPGKVILWIFYMLPSGGYAKTRMSARWARSPIMTLIVGGVFWLSMLGLLLLVLFQNMQGKGI